MCCPTGQALPEKLALGENMVMHNVPPGASRSFTAIRVFSMLLPGLKVKHQVELFFDSQVQDGPMIHDEHPFIEICEVKVGIS